MENMHGPYIDSYSKNFRLIAFILGVTRRAKEKRG